MLGPFPSCPVLFLSALSPSRLFACACAAARQLWLVGLFPSLW